MGRRTRTVAHAAASPSVPDLQIAWLSRSNRDVVALHADGVPGDGLSGRRSSILTGPQVEPAAVKGALHLVTLHFAV